MPKHLFKKGHKNCRRKEHKIENNIERKHCPTCDTWKVLNEYNRQSSSWDNLGRMCRKCNNDYKREKRTTPQYIEKDKEYAENPENIKRRKETDALRYIKNRKSIIKKCVAYNKKRYHEDPYFKLKCNYRSRLGRVLRAAKVKKNYKSMELIGESPTFVLIYIAFLFIEGMSLENQGVWHIDHIKPCSLFNFNNPEEVKMCFHYTNLQPLTAAQNLFKKDKYNREQDPRIWTGTEWSWGKTTRRILLFK